LRRSRRHKPTCAEEDIPCRSIVFGAGLFLCLKDLRLNEKRKKKEVFSETADNY